MRLEIRYVTSFSYPEPVLESYNALRACPTTDLRQQLVSYTVSIDPPARIHSYVDYWGTRVDNFGIKQPHDRLVVVADSVVEVADQQEPVAGVSLDALRDPAFTEAHWQFLQPTDHTRWNDAVATAAAAAIADSSDAVSAIRAVAAAISDRLEYAPGATFVGMDVNDVYAQGKGVCQDFVHLGLAMYRSAGIPARYVSGYFYAADQAVGTAPVEAEIDVQTHAWLEVALPDAGWWPLDPTNPASFGDRHVKIGHGRDYDDVTPLRGVFHGSAEQDLAVSVRISRDEMAAYQHQQ